MSVTCLYLATGSAQGTVRGNCDSVQVTGVVIVVLLQSAVGQVPDLSKEYCFSDRMLVLRVQDAKSFKLNVSAASQLQIFRSLFFICPYL